MVPGIHLMRHKNRQRKNRLLRVITLHNVESGSPILVGHWVGDRHPKFLPGILERWEVVAEPAEDALVAALEEIETLAKGMDGVCERCVTILDIIQKVLGSTPRNVEWG